MKLEPDAARLLAAVREALVEEVVPQLKGQARYQALLAANAVAVASREMEVQDGELRLQAEAISSLLDEAPADAADAAEFLSGCESRLINAIREGQFDAKAKRPELVAVLRRMVIHQLRLTNPKIAAKYC